MDYNKQEKGLNDKYAKSLLIFVVDTLFDSGNFEEDKKIKEFKI